jgi:hypothetical protein
LTGLSAVDKYSRDRSIERLLEMDGDIYEVGGGFWVKFEACRVPPTALKPHGIDYSLCFFGPDDVRRVCYDNDHQVLSARPPRGKMSPTNDHRHVGSVIKPYSFIDAQTLIEDFWNDVYKILKKEGIP